MSYLITAIAAMTLATLLTRAFPFLLYAKRKPPQKLISAAKLIPGAVMTILVCTALPIGGNPAAAETWLPWLSAAVVALLHLTMRHSLVSILGGTAFYMVMLQLVPVSG
jgi:branched-subunit amino acid transport protein AzlD